MEKDLYRGRRLDPRKGPQAPDKTGKAISSDKMKRDAANLLNKAFKEAKEKQEYDYEGDMAMSQLKSIIANAQRIHDMLERDTNIPEWVQSKITLAEDYIITASNYMQGEMSEETKWVKDKHGSGYTSSDGKRVIVKHPKGWISRSTTDRHDYSDVYPTQREAKAGKYAWAMKNEEADTIHSVHVGARGADGKKQLNSPEFKKHLAAQHGEVHYMSDKGIAFKFKKDYHAAAFHRGIQSHFRHLSAENDGPVHEEAPVNVAANVADPKNKRLFGQSMKRFKNFKAQ